MALNMIHTTNDIHDRHGSVVFKEGFEMSIIKLLLRLPLSSAVTFKLHDAYLYLY